MKTYTFTGFLAASTILSYSALAQSTVAHGNHPATQQASAPQKSGTASPPPSKVEILKVLGHVLPNGVNRQAVGGGLMVNVTDPKARQVVTQDYIAKQVPSANPEQLLQLQPGANVTKGDPFGLSVGHMTVRGLDISEIGWMFNGMPFNNGAVYPNEIVDSANLSSIALTPGSVDFDVPTFGAAAGVVDMTFREPAHKAGGYINLGYGSYNYNNEFIRLDSGDIGRSGVRAFFSFSHTFADAWHGPGYSQRRHIDFKMVKDFKNGSSSSLSVAWNHQEFILDRWPTMSQWNQAGTKWTYASTFTPGTNTFWGMHMSAFDNVAVSAPNHIKLTPAAEIVFTPYFFHGHGAGPGGANVTETGLYSGAEKVPFISLPLSNGTGANANSTEVFTPTIYDQFRSGANLAFNYKLKHHTLTLGYWYEYQNASTVGLMENIKSNGMPVSLWGSSGIINLPNGTPYKSSQTLTLGQVNGLYIGDRAHFFHDRLEIDGGFKEVMYTERGYNGISGATPTTLVAGAEYNRNVHYAVPLPTLAARYTFNENHMIFLNGGTNFLAPASSQLFDVFSMTSGARTQQGGTSLKPEYSIVEEIGYRYHDRILSGSVTFFNYNFTNRQISTTLEQNNVLVTQYMNAGGQTSRGVDVEIGFRPWHHLRPFLSGEYLNATTDSNMITSSGAYLPTAGKTAVRSPHWMGSASLDYDDGHFFGNVSAHYTSSQYSTFMDDEKMPAYVTADMTLGYRLQQLGFAKSPTVQMNFVNIANNHYLGGVYTVQNNAHAARAMNGSTVQASGSPTYLPGAGFAAVASISTAF